MEICVRHKREIVKLFLELKDNLHVSFAGKTYNIISLNQEKSKQVWPDKYRFVKRFVSKRSVIIVLFNSIQQVHYIGVH